MAKKNPLSEGIVGRNLIGYFDQFENKTPVGAELLRVAELGENPNKDQVQYRITFDDGSVSDWLVTFEPDFSFTILSAECFNEVIG